MTSILIVHSKYASGELSGENKVVSQQIAALLNKGFNIKTYIPDSGKILASRRDILKTGINVALRKGLTPELNSNFDLVIVHNLFPNLSSNWMTSSEVPIVRFHHNYRDFCANGILWRDGKICTLCVTGSSLHAVKHKCYRNSSIATIPVSISRLTPLERRAEFIAPKLHVAVSEFQATNLISFGYPPEKIRVLPNYSSGEMNVLQKRSDRWVAFGRLDQGKGFQELVRNWPDDLPLDIYGTGSLFDSISQILSTKRSLIYLKGSVENSVLLKKLSSYSGCIIPSNFLEAAPLVLPESLRAGLPVIALKHTAVGAAINQFKCGVVLDDMTRENLLDAIKTINADCENFRKIAHLTWVSHYSEKIWWDRFKLIINEAKELKDS
jgi:glycosyltransferase involved in cell wall biosynthesis